MRHSLDTLKIPQEYCMPGRTVEHMSQFFFIGRPNGSESNLNIVTKRMGGGDICRVESRAFRFENLVRIYDLSISGCFKQICPIIGMDTKVPFGRQMPCQCIVEGADGIRQASLLSSIRDATCWATRFQQSSVFHRSMYMGGSVAWTRNSKSDN
jgi:hypothetical protein